MCSNCRDPGLFKFMSLYRAPYLSLMFVSSSLFRLISRNSNWPTQKSTNIDKTKIEDALPVVEISLDVREVIESYKFFW